MEETTKIIAVVRGASNCQIQAIFRALADKWQPDVRLAGLVAENHGLPDRHCQAGYLRNLTTGARFSIFHDLGRGVAMCHLDGGGAVAAAAAVQRDIAAECDLVLLNKFGKLEIAGDGLASAFPSGGHDRQPPPADVGFSPPTTKHRRRFAVESGVCGSSRGPSHDRPVASLGSDAIRRCLHKRARSPTDPRTPAAACRTTCRACGRTSRRAG